MKYIILLSLLMFAGCNRATESKAHLARDEKATVTVYSLDANKQLGDLVKQCYDQSKIPILYFHADWCGPCVAFKKSLTDKLMNSALENAMLIGVNVDADPQHMTKLYSVTAVPTFIKLDKDSRAIARITSGAWDEDIPKNIAPVMDKFINQIN